jgi:hypothetical protein
MQETDPEKARVLHLLAEEAENGASCIRHHLSWPDPSL